MMERKQIEDKYDEFFGTGYWEVEYKKHIVEFAFQCSNSIKLPVSRSATDYGGYEESLKADLQNAIELQEQQQREEFNAGREAGLRYAIEMLHKHFG